MISFDGSAPAPARDRARTDRLIEELVSANALATRPDSTAVLEDDDFLLSDETLEVEPAESPLRRYLAYQAKDFLRQRAAWLLALGVLGVYFLWDNLPDAMASRPGGARLDERETFRALMLGGGSLFAFLATVFATHGIVSAERERGLQRFLFAKPVARLPYYLQKLGVAFVGTLAVVTVVALLAGAVFGRAMPLSSILTMTTALFASVGGLTFFLSTLVRFEGGLALVLSLAVIPLRAVAYELNWQLLGALRYVLPPLERLGPLVDPRELGDPLRAVLWALAYGAVYVAAGFAVLRRRSILT